MSEFCSPYIIDADLDLGIDDIGDTGGTDTLDFSSTGGFVAVNVDLSKITTQTIASGLQLTFSTVSIENIYGGGGDDTLFGNRLDNSIIGNRVKILYLVAQVTIASVSAIRSLARQYSRFD